MRGITLEVTSPSIPASGSGTFDISLGYNSVDILAVTVVPSVVGGTFEFQVYVNNSYAANKLLIAQGPANARIDDPEHNDGVTITAGLEGFLAPYTDENSGSNLHCKIYNNDGSAKTFTVTVQVDPRAKILSTTTTWDPASIANNASTSTDVTLTGAALGDVCFASFSLTAAGGAIFSAIVSAADTVRVTLYNGTGSTLNLGSGTLRVGVLKF